MIKTKEFSFPKSKYLTILIRNSLKRSLWAIGFLVVITMYQATKGYSKMVLFLAALPTVYFFYIVVRCWIHSNSKTNKLFFKERVFEIDNQTIIVTFRDGISSKIQIDSIARVIKNAKFYLLFLSKKQFVYLPLSAFRTAGDINRFDSILKSRKRGK